MTRSFCNPWDITVIQTLEKYQVLIYLAAILVGMLLGALVPSVASALELALWPVLGLMLYVTFIQIPLLHLRDALLDTRFLSAAVVGNFILLPLLVGLLLWLAPDDPVLRLGIALVLLAPCTDWFITFTRLGGGDTHRAIAFSPLALLLQIALLPFYLWLYFGAQLTVSLGTASMLWAFGGLIVLPLLLAWWTERTAQARPPLARWVAHSAWLPVPLLALVVLIIASSQVSVVLEAGPILFTLTLIFAAFLLIAAFAAHLLMRVFRLPYAQGRTLAYSLGTRNSFVVLPVALVLPGGYELVVVVVVFQSLVELLGMVAYLWWLPRSLFPGRP